MSNYKLITRLLLTQRPLFFLFSIIFIVDSALLVVAGVSIAPLADWFVDPNLVDVSQPTKIIISFLSRIHQPVGVESFMLILGFSIVGKGVSDFSVRYLSLKLKYRFQATLAEWVIEGYLDRDSGSIISIDQGVMLNTFNRELPIVGEGTGHCLAFACSIIQFVLLISIPFSVNPVVSFVAVCSVSLIVLPFALFYRWGFRLSKDALATANNLAGWVKEIAVGWKTLIANNSTNVASVRYIELFEKHVVYAIRSQMLQAVSSVFFHPAAVVGSLAAVYVGISTGVSLGELAVVLWSFMKAAPQGSLAYDSSLSLIKMIPSVMQIEALIKDAPKSNDVGSMRPTSEIENVTSVRMSQIKFNYSSVPVLQNFSFGLNVGELVAIEGKSGSGKSTVLDILMGFLNPSEGYLSINDDLIIHGKQLRELSAYIPQDGVLFRASIKDNLTLFDNSIETSVIRHACECAGVWHVISGLEKGLSSELADFGAGLSGGQKQRLMIARALISRPRFLFLDESLSGIDAVACSDIMNRLKVLARSESVGILIVTHNEQIIESCDRSVRIRS